MRGREAGVLGFGDWGPPKGETASEKGKALFVSRRLHQGGMNWVEGSPPSPQPSPPGEGAVAAHSGCSNSIVANPAVGTWGPPKGGTMSGEVAG